MERWRKFFHSAGVDLWTICERALAVAYLDHPDDFPSERDRLAQKLFAPEKLDLQAREDDAPKATRSDYPSRDDENDDRFHGAQNPLKSEASSDEDYRLHTPNGAYDEVEALTEEMEEENLLKGDVLRIKDILLDSYQPEREIFDSLQRLELMRLSFDVLKDTEIGKTVNSLRKHSSRRVASLAKRLVSEWKDIAEDWYKSAEDVTAAATAGSPASDSPDDAAEEHGLPSPPMDEGALLAARTASLEMSQLFDFMDDDTSAGSGNPDSPVDNLQPLNSKKAIDNFDNRHNLQTVNKHSEHRNSTGRDRNEVETKKSKERASVTSSNGHSKRERDLQITNDCNGKRGTNGYVERKAQRETIEKRPETGTSRRAQTSKPGVNTAVSKDPPQLDQKLLATKRKLQQNYQQAEIAKRQRTIQVMELQDLPKGGPNRAKASHLVHGKPVSQHRPRALGRR